MWSIKCWRSEESYIAIDFSHNARWQVCIPYFSGLQSTKSIIENDYKLIVQLVAGSFVSNGLF